MMSISKIIALTALALTLTCRAETSHWSTMTTMPPGVKMMVLQGDPAKPGPFIVRLKLPSNYITPAHSHSTEEHDTVISGVYYFGLGPVADANQGKALQAGDKVTIPANTKHYGWTTAQTIIEVSGMGPWEMMYTDNG
jgi:quercetin dioxygenase-like cupin family protein